MRANSLLAGEGTNGRRDDIAIASSVKSVLVVDVGGSSIKNLRDRPERAAIISIRADADARPDDFRGQEARRRLEL